jgi:hypothetical protein
VHDADQRSTIHHEADRDAEERDPIRVIHGPVERIDDPDAAATRGGRLAFDGSMLPALLGEDRVPGVAGSNRVDHEGLGQVVRLCHDVTRGLVVDAFEAFVSIHQDFARSGRERDGEREVVVDHGVRQVTMRSRGSSPNSVTTALNVRVWWASSRGVVTNAAVPTP